MAPKRDEDAERVSKRRRTPSALVLNSELVRVLLTAWAWGTKSAIEVQAEANAALNDQYALLESLKLSRDFANTSLYTLAALGTFGKYPNHIKGDLLRALGDINVPEPLFANVPLKVSKPAQGKDTVCETAFPILLPHELFAYLYHCRRDIFNRNFLGGDDSNNLARFWDAMVARRDPRLEGHSVTSRENWKHLACPIMLHGDAVPCTGVGRAGTQSFDACSFQGLMASGSTLEVKHFIFGVYESSKIKDAEHDTMFSIWRVVMWSLWFAYLGIWPLCDYMKRAWPVGSVEAKRAGTPLADGNFIVLYLIKADLEHLTKEYGLAHYASNHPCCLCPANRDEADPDMNWNNFKTTSKWRRLIYTAAEWRSDLLCLCWNDVPLSKEYNVRLAKSYALRRT